MTGGATAMRDYGNVRPDGERPEHIYTLEEAIDHMGVGKFQLLFLGILIIGWTADAMEILILSVLGPELRCEWNLTITQSSLLPAFSFLGMTILAAFWGTISDKFGRMFELEYSSTMLLFLGLLCAAAPTFFWVVLLRFFVGGTISGTYQFAAIVPEIVPRTKRGTFIWLMNISFVIGGGFAVGLAWLLMPSAGWRTYLAISNVPTLVFLVAIQWLPESPHYFMASGRPREAKKVLDIISKMNGVDLPPGTLEERYICEPRGECSELISTPFLRRMTALLPSIWFFTGFSFYGIIFMASTIFKQENHCQGYEVEELECHEACAKMGSDEYLSLFVISLADIPCILFSTVVIDVIGRKPLLVGGATLSALATLILLNCWESRVFTTVGLFIARGAMDVTYITLFAYTPEVYPTRVRALGLGLCNGSSRLGATLTPLVAQIIAAYSPQVSLLIYTVCSILVAVGCLFLPETLGKPIPDEEMWRRNTNIRPSLANDSMKDGADRHIMPTFGINSKANANDPQPYTECSKWYQLQSR